MILSEAAQLLEVPIDASVEQLENRFLELRRKLEDKIAKAPTPGLQAKYRASLTQITEAFELLTLAADGDMLPVLERATTKPATAAHPMAAPADTGPAAAKATSKAPAKGNREFLVVALIAVLLLGAGGWWIMHTRAQSAERVRVEAAVAAEAEQRAAEQVRIEREAALAADAEFARLRAAQAEARIHWETIEREVAAAERRLAEIRSDARAADRLPAPEQAELRARLAAQEDYIRWVKPYVTRHPARTELARLDALLSSNALEDATATEQELAASLVRANKTIASQQKAILSITGAVKIISEPSAMTVKLIDAYGRLFTLKTPITTEFPTGALEVAIDAPAGWEDFRQTVRVSNTGDLEVPVRFERGTLRLDSSPAGQAYAIVNTRGYRATGITPVELIDVPLGPVDVQITAPEGWLDYRETVELTRDEPQARAALFDAGRIRIDSVPEGLPYVVTNSVGYRNTGTTPIELEDVPVGQIEVKVNRPDWGVKKIETREILGGQTAESVMSEFHPGTIEITSSPSGVEVWEGSEKIGVTPLTLLGRLPGAFEGQLRAPSHRVVTVSGAVTMAETLRFAAELEIIPEGEPVELGETRSVPGLNLTLIGIMPGHFQRGSMNGDADEQPVHTVEFTRGYWLGRTEVTQGQWRSIMGTNPSHFNGDDRPVEQVSWEDAMAFCRKLTERERAEGRLPDGFAYTLPTEAQWEHACRAGTTGDYAGSLDAMGWYYENSDSANVGTLGGAVKYWYGGEINIRETHPVGRKQANAWGFYDMHGNVWEWCSDWYGTYPSGTVTDPTGSSSGAYRVNRGGGWSNTARNCRAAYRSRNAPATAGNLLGFRLALSSIQ